MCDQLNLVYHNRGIRHLFWFRIQKTPFFLSTNFVSLQVFFSELNISFHASPENDIKI